MKTLVITGPSAVGKTYLAGLLIQDYPLLFKQAKVYTTRIPRAGESGTDRIFVEKNVYFKMLNNNDFLVSGKFGGNYYGFNRESIFPTKNQHLIVNAWPAILDKFVAFDHTVLVGLQAKKSNLSLLQQRMLSRGDTNEAIEARLKLIVKDIRDLNNHSKTFDYKGKIFMIDNDHAIKDKVVTWLKDELSLK